MPENESDESDGKQQEDWDVGEGAWVFIEESSGIFEHNSLEFDFTGVHANHNQQQECEKEADNSDYDFKPMSSLPETTITERQYPPPRTSSRTPMAMSAKMAKA